MAPIQLGQETHPYSSDNIRWPRLLRATTLERTCAIARRSLFLPPHAPTNSPDRHRLCRIALASHKIQCLPSSHSSRDPSSPSSGFPNLSTSLQSLPSISTIPGYIAAHSRDTLQSSTTPTYSSVLLRASMRRVRPTSTGVLGGSGPWDTGNRPARTRRRS